MNRKINIFGKSVPLKKIIAAALLFLIAVIAVVAVVYAADKYKEEQYRATFGQSAVEVGGYTVKYELYRYFYLNYRDELEGHYTVDGVTDTAALDREIRERIEEALTGLYGSVSLAGDYGITLDDGDVRAASLEYVDAVKEYYKSDAAFEKELEANYMTENVFKLLMSIDSLEDKLFTVLVSDGGRIEDNDEKLMALFIGDGFVRAKQIFIENDEGEDVEANRALAREALDAYKSGESMNTLIGRYSEDFSMPADGYYFTYLEMIEEFERAAFALRDGEVSDVVESEDGFHIIFRLPKDDAYLQENFSDLKSQYQSSAFYKMIEERSAMLRASETEYVRSLSYGEIY